MKKDNKKPIPLILETSYVDKDANALVFHLPNGKPCHIGKYEQDFFFKLKELPAETKIMIFGIKVEDMEKEIDRQKKSAITFVTELLSFKWYSRETGEEFDFEDAQITGLEYSFEDFKKKMKGKIKPKLKEITAVVNFFCGDNSEVYRLDEEGEKIFIEENKL